MPWEKNEIFDQNSRNATMIQSLFFAVLKWLLHLAVEFSAKGIPKRHDLQG